MSKKHPGPAPKDRTWINVQDHEFTAALNSIHANKITLTRSDIGHQEQYRDRLGEVVARRYEHKRSTQCLIHQSMRNHIPQRHAPKDTSLYDNNAAYGIV